MLYLEAPQLANQNCGSGGTKVTPLYTMDVLALGPIGNSTQKIIGQKCGSRLYI